MLATIVAGNRSYMEDGPAPEGREFLARAAQK
jgi:hypothetical protein